MLSLRVLLIAEPYGFGPAALCAQLGERLRPLVSYLAFVGSGHSLQLQEAVAYDSVHDLSTEQQPQLFTQLMAQHDVVISSMDMSALRLLEAMQQEHKPKVVLYDALYWYYDVICPQVFQVDLLLAQGFLGVRERLRDTGDRFAGAVEMVPPIVGGLFASQRWASDPQAPGDYLHVSFGGLVNPSLRIEQVGIYAAAIGTAARTAGLPTRFIGNQDLAEPSGLPIRKVSPSESQERLAGCRVAIMTPGLGNIYEAAASGRHVLWMPPTNPSQARQVWALRSRGFSKWSVGWHEVLGLVQPMDETKDIHSIREEILSNIVKLAEDETCRQRLEAVLSDKLKSVLAEVGVEPPLEAGLLAELGASRAAAGMDKLVDVLHSFLADSEPPNRSSLRCRIGGGLCYALDSSSVLPVDAALVRKLSAHLPGLRVDDHPEEGQHDVHLVHREVSTGMRLVQSSASPGEPVRAQVYGSWEDVVPEDCIHLSYAMCRTAWLRSGLYPVHAAAVGSAQGVALLMGPPGSGKTSVSLQCVLDGLQLFSGDKTLICLDGVSEGQPMTAEAGTHSLTLRNQDLWRWEDLPKEHTVELGTRLAFQLQAKDYVEGSVPVKAVFMLKIDDARDDVYPASALSALHTLYPFFLDKQREDCIVREGLWDGSASRARKQSLSDGLRAAMQGVPMHTVFASCARIAALVKQSLDQ